MLSSGEQLWQPRDITRWRAMALGGQFFICVAMHMSRSVIMPATRPVCASSTGTAPQSQSHINCAGTLSESLVAHHETPRLIKSATRMVDLLGPKTAPRDSYDTQEPCT